MTLQDFKDQVARDYRSNDRPNGFKSWNYAMSHASISLERELHDRAATLFAEHERIAAHKAGFDAGFSEGYEKGERESSHRTPGYEGW